ncbi:MAG: FHA domain-containing protein [Planctomycetota bacterium]
MEAILVMFKADGSRKDFPIKGSKRYVIGRKDNCDLRIPLAEVSREHAAIYFDEEEEELVIEDLGSSNGTWVNDEKVDRADLCPGDVILVGDVPLQIVIDGHPAEVHPIKPTAKSERGGDNGTPAPASAAAGSGKAGQANKPIPLDDDDDDDDDFDLDALASEEDEDDSFFNFDVDEDAAEKKERRS